MVNAGSMSEAFKRVSHNKRSKQMQSTVPQTQGLNFKRIRRDVCEQSFSKIMDSIQNSSLRSRLIHDIIPCTRIEERNGGVSTVLCGKTAGKAIIKKFREYFEGVTKETSITGKKRPAIQAYQGGLFICAFHESPGFEHVHIVHDCTYSNSSCRCGFRGQLDSDLYKERRRRSRHVSAASTKILNTAEYLLLRGGRHHFIYTGSGGISVLRQTGNLSRQRDGFERQISSLEGEVEDLFFGCKEKSAGDNTHYSKVDPSTGRPGGERKNQGRLGREGVQEAVLAFLNTHLFSPPEIAGKSMLYLNMPELKWVSPGSELFEAAMERYRRELCAKSIYEIYTHYTQPGRYLHFEAVTDPFDNLYYSLETSYEILKSLLDNQFGGNMEEGHSFMVYLLRLLLKRNGKKNCLVLWGEHSKGKSWFAKALRGICISVGTAQTLNKNNSFPLMDCHDRNLIIFDELNYDITMFASTLKTLLSGDMTAVDVKYKAPQIVLKTPIIAMNNHEQIFPQNDIYRSRINSLCWNPGNIPMERLLHPHCLIKYWVEDIGEGEWPDDDLLFKDTKYMY